VLEAVVIGLPDEKWGERPEKFVVLRAGAQVSEGELIAHRWARIARYTSSEAVEFVAALPETSTGKVHWSELREKEWARHVSRIQG
jgi:acyl-CoA synthetase (AMP-forming)/AMP-acid ligase II